MSTIPAAYSGLVDDAAIFPPGSTPLAEAVAAHHRHRRAGYADLVGRFVVDDVRLPELRALLEQEPAEEPLAVTVVVTGGAGALEPAVRWATGTDLLALAGVETALRDLDDLTGNARRVTAAVDRLQAAGELDPEVPVYVEPPLPGGGLQPGPGWHGALDEVAALDLRLKFRTGGTDAAAFPAPTALATAIAAGLDRELAFKCTAGLHRALRHVDAGSRTAHHGFLNVLLATRASLDGAPVEEVAAVLDQEDPTAVRDLLDRHGPQVLAGTRRWFTAVGSCSVAEPLQDLTGLGLLPDLLPDPTQETA